MRNNKPIIGLTSNILEIDGNKTTTVFVSYSEAIKKSGGIPLIFPLGNDELAKIWVSMVDGILLTGGIDVDPKFYNEKPSENIDITNEDLDQSDFKIINEARKQGKPLFGICRGSHLINVAAGGSLHQDVKEDKEEKGTDSMEHLTNVERPEPVHTIYIDKSSQLYSIAKKEKIDVNSFHHQGVKELGEGLKPVAKAEDGLIEAFEGIDESIMGTQFHPEELRKHDASMDKLLKHFISVCKDKALSREQKDTKE